MKRWKIEVFNKQAQCIGSGKAGNLSQAMEQAQASIVGIKGRSACISNRTTGKVKMRYWWDGQLQYMNY